MKTTYTIVFLSQLISTLVFSKTGIDLHQIYSAKNTKFMSIESPLLTDLEENTILLNQNRKWYFDFNLDTVKNPLIYIDKLKNERTGIIVAQFTSLNLSTGYQFNKIFSFFGELSAHKIHLDQNIGIDTDSTVLGDSRILGKLLLYNSNESANSFLISIIPELTVPTGNTQYFSSVGSFGYGVLLTLEKNYNSWVFTGNLGLRYAKDALFKEIDYSTLYPYALGVLYMFNSKWGLTTEFNGSIASSSRELQNHAELYAGPRWIINNEFTFLSGFGTGRFKETMANDFRAIVQLKYIPEFKDKMISNTKIVNNTNTEALSSNNSNLCGSTIILFENNSTHLTKLSIKNVKLFSKKIIDFINKTEFDRIEITGHASPIGKPQHNIKIAFDRSFVSKKFLSQLGIPKNLISIKSFGSEVTPLGLFKSESEKINSWRRAEFKCYLKNNLKLTPALQ